MGKTIDFMTGGGGGEYATSVSSANPATSRAGEGDFIVTGGANKAILYFVSGFVGVAFIGALIYALVRKRKKP